MVPAIQLYDGPRFQLVRRYLRQTQDRDLDIAIISARHGLVRGDALIDHYNRKMTAARASELRPSVLSGLRSLIGAANDIFVSASTVYLETLVGFEETAAADRNVLFASGGQGSRMGQLRRWLYRSATVTPNDERFAYRGEAKLGGKTVKMSPEQVLDFARGELKLAGSDARHFRDWYVDLGGSRVSSKWLVSRLTGVPVQRFQAFEARRVLAQLGVEVKRVPRDGSGEKTPGT